MPDLPVPTRPGESLTYDIDDGKGGRLEARVEMRTGNAFYGDAGEFDFEAISAGDLRRKLMRWNARHVGYDHRRA